MMGSDTEIFVEVGGVQKKFLVSKNILHLMEDHGYTPQAEFMEAITNGQQIESVLMRSQSNDSGENYIEWYSKQGFVLVGYFQENPPGHFRLNGLISRLREILTDAEGFSTEI